jgi:hypothetical protein
MKREHVIATLIVVTILAVGFGAGPLQAYASGSMITPTATAAYYSVSSISIGNKANELLRAEIDTASGCTLTLYKLGIQASP